MIQSVDAAISALLIVFGTIAILIIVLGLFMVVTGKDVVPNVLRTRLRRVPATPRDQRVVGAAGVFGALAVFLLTLGVATEHSPLWDLAALACLTVGLVLNLLARRVDRRENRVSSGWEDITRTFR